MWRLDNETNKKSWNTEIFLPDPLITLQKFRRVIKHHLLILHLWEILWYYWIGTNTILKNENTDIFWKKICSLKACENKQLSSYKYGTLSKNLKKKKRKSKNKSKGKHFLRLSIRWTSQDCMQMRHFRMCWTWIFCWGQPYQEEFVVGPKTIESIYCI